MADKIVPTRNALVAKNEPWFRIVPTNWERDVLALAGEAWPAHSADEPCILVYHDDSRARFVDLESANGYTLIADVDWKRLKPMLLALLDRSA